MEANAGPPSKWKRRVLTQGARFEDATYPFVLRLEDGTTIESLQAAAECVNLVVRIFPRNVWRDVSGSLAAAARRNELSHIVLQGLATQGRRSAQCAIRRFEAIQAWRENVYQTHPSLEADVIIGKQIRYGLSRERLRAPRKTPAVIARAPIAPLKHKTDYTAFYQVADALSAIWCGSQRTTRVFDETGAEAWIVPQSTLSALPLFWIEPVPTVEASPEPVPPAPEIEGPEGLVTADDLSRLLFL